jgi:hypothetical protein
MREREREGEREREREREKEREREGGGWGVRGGRQAGRGERVIRLALGIQETFGDKSSLSPKVLSS